MEHIYEELASLIRSYAFKRKYPFPQTVALADLKIRNAEENLKGFVSKDILATIREISQNISPDDGLENSRLILLDIFKAYPNHKVHNISIAKDVKVIAASKEEALSMVKTLCKNAANF